MQSNSVKNVIQFIVKNPGRLKELVSKMFLRFSKKDSQKDMEWIRTNQVNFNNWAMKIDPAAWKESEAFSEKLKADAKVTLASIPVKLGGAGLYPVLYFLTLYRKPKVIVETGVAAGFSSKTFLSALKRNGFGELYSSDFPYFRIPNPEKYVGILVNEDLRKDWHLYIEGDKKNIPVILSKIDKIDLFHYDSDKSYESREYTFNLVKNKLHKDSYILFDDIQNNNHFKDFVIKNKFDFYVFEFEGKHVGLIYNYNPAG